MVGFWKVRLGWLACWEQRFVEVLGGFRKIAAPLNGGDAMIGREKRVLLRHYLD